ncbi:MAG: restriction endonuclease [Candidatus Paceibacterota bacterium]
MIDIFNWSMLKITLISLWQMFVGLWWVWSIAIFAIILPRIVERLVERIITSCKFKKGERIRSDAELLNWIGKLSHKEFELYVAELFRKLGYKADVIGGTGDGGIDIVLERDGKKSYVQCKQYNSKVQVDKIRDFYGAIVSKFSNAKCYFVTNNYFTLPAEEFARDKPIELIDGQQLIKDIRIFEEKVEPQNHNS